MINDGDMIYKSYVNAYCILILYDNSFEVMILSEIAEKKYFVYNVTIFSPSPALGMNHFHLTLKNLSKSKHAMILCAE